MKLLMCNCRICKYYRKTGFTQYIIHHRRSAVRSKTRRLLRKGEYDNLPAKVYIGYPG